MSAKSALAPQVLGRLAIKLTALPEEDLQLVLELVDRLEERRPVASARSLSVKEIGEEARKRALLLRDVPRDQLVARFVEVGEQIRQAAIANDTAIDGDWTGD
jgi:hypothetical protein